MFRLINRHSVREQIGSFSVQNVSLEIFYNERVQMN